MKTYSSKHYKLWVQNLLENFADEDYETSLNLPSVDNEYNIKNFNKFKQKYFHINEINLNLRMTKKGIIEIETDALREFDV